MKSAGRIAIAIDGVVMKDEGGWYWPLTDIGAWACEREFRRLGHAKLADQVQAAINEAKQQKEEMVVG